MAERFPDEIIIWVEEKFVNLINKPQLNNIFCNKRIMASYAVDSNFFSHSLGYIDQMPFININPRVKYATWLMSTDVGGIFGRTLSYFKSECGDIIDFGYLINSIAKKGQQNGLFCYSHPDLITNASKCDIHTKASLKQEFSFVYSNYKTVWVFVFFWCQWRYENKFPLISFLKCFFRKKKFGIKLNLPFPDKLNEIKINHEDSIDVIIPTIGRAEYLENVLKDLNNQTHLPANVIVIEQHLNGSNSSRIEHLDNNTWKFNLNIITLDTAGVCKARNIGLNLVTSNWIFFADDDIRFSPGLLEKGMTEAAKFDCEAINMNCKQEGEKTIFHNIKQWGSFGSGTSLVKNKFARKCNFSEIFEEGYGEDADYGMQLRNLGCDIIYHPEIQILHLKAASGGFRSIINEESTKSKEFPKPAPTIMAFALRHFTKQQLKGFKLSLFLKFYKEKSILNPFIFLRSMQKRWELSEKKAYDLIKMSKSKTEV
ncbi:glycosyltransferase family A protein [Christiangramia sp.]|uniref:glycosyltransferase family 2 protein n=1 Tax=Christiangramia sp. TaxID=1931228 RepID=UPI003241CF3C